MTRSDVRNEVDMVRAADKLEQETKSDVLSWIDSGAQLFRLEKPATPRKHLVSYFVLVDGDHVLLVDHINAGLWLPTGGHVEEGEHPRTTALREVREELGIDAEFLHDRPLPSRAVKQLGSRQGTSMSLFGTS